MHDGEAGPKTVRWEPPPGSTAQRPWAGWWSSRESGVVGRFHFARTFMLKRRLPRLQVPNRFLAARPIFRSARYVVLFMENHDTGTKSSMDVLLVDKTPSKPTATADLSAEIAMSVEREKGEKVKCRRIYGDNYRCNWLTIDGRASQRGMSLALETYRIRESKFLRVKKVGEQLVIEDVTAAAATN